MDADRLALEKIREFGCHICEAPPPVDIHHWVSRGAGGGDELENLVTLCRRHHTEFHQIGALTFWHKYEKQLRQFRVFNNLPPINRGKHG